MKKKILFVKQGGFSNVNDIVESLLKKNFPSLDVDVVDLQKILKAKSLFNILMTVKAYGLKSLYYNYSSAFYISKRAHFLIKKKLREIIDPEEYVFSVQTQSLFDASFEGLPNFVYTDNTHKADFEYQDFSQSRRGLKLFKEVFVAFLKGDSDEKQRLKHKVSVAISEELKDDAESIALEQEIYDNAKTVFTMSSNVSRSLVNDYKIDEDKVKCVFVGSNASWTESEIKFNHEKYSSKHILFVALRWASKGGPMLVDAFRKVLKKIPDARLTIVGCSPDIDVPSCNVVGYLPLEEVNKYYESAAVFCLPTFRDACGGVYIEAMSHKLPIIGTNISALPDFIKPGENGYLVERKDVQSLADYLLELIGDPNKCRDFGERGYLIAKNNYDWHNTGKLMKEYIEEKIGVQNI